MPVSCFILSAQFELMDADMVEFGIDLTNTLDRRFGQPPKFTLSQVRSSRLSGFRICKA